MLESIEDNKPRIILLMAKEEETWLIQQEDSIDATWKWKIKRINKIIKITI